MAKKRVASIKDHPDKPKCSVITIRGDEYEVDRYFGDGIDAVIGSIISDKGNLICCRMRDFGGCGKDALKPERNVPVGLWLIEIHAREVVKS